MKYYIGVDVGATKIAAALVSGNQIIKKIKVKTDAKKAKSVILNNIKSAIKEVYTPQVKGIGIGIAGQVDQKNGILVSSPNFDKNFKNVNLSKLLKNSFKKPILVENDANCFTLGEAITGKAKGYKYVVGLTLGTGVGSGIVINKKIYRGSNGLAAEIGHTTIVENGLKCGCGRDGHLESYASGSAMSRLHKKLTGHTKHPLQIEEEAKLGNKKAKEVFNIMSNSLAIGFANIIHTLNPDIIILGGGLAKVKILIDPAIKLVKPKLIYSQYERTKIVSTKPNSDTAILGTTFLFK